MCIEMLCVTWCCSVRILRAHNLLKEYFSVERKERAEVTCNKRVTRCTSSGCAVAGMRL